MGAEVCGWLVLVAVTACGDEQGGDLDDEASADTDAGVSSDTGDSPQTSDGSSDEGPEASSDGTADGGDTYGAAFCGNGVVEVHEHCDDANDVDADGCNVDCRVSGSIVWTWTHDGDAHLEDGAASIAVLPDGSPLAGGLATATDGSHGWIRRYDEDGAVVWVDERALADVGGIAVDRDGFVVACGTSIRDGATEVWARRYAAEGELDWHVAWAHPDALDDACSDIAAAADGRIVVTGSVTAPEGAEMWLAKLNSHGAALWDTREDDARAGVERAHAVAIDHAGEIIVAGRLGPAQTQAASVFVGRWSSGGEGPQESYFTPDEEPVLGEARGLAVDASEVLVVGALASSHTTRGFYARLDDALGGPIALHEDPDVVSIDAVGVDAEGNVVMVGAVLGADGSRDFWIEKRDPQWQPRWTTVIAGNGGHDELAADVAIAPDGIIFVAGSIGTDTDGLDATVTAIAP
jgi:cysteine-rich repeat protein